MSLCDDSFTWPTKPMYSMRFPAVDRAMVMVGFIYVFYMIPLTYAALFGTMLIVKLIPSLAPQEDMIRGFVNSVLLNLFLS